LIEFLFGHEISRRYSLLSVGLAVAEGRSSDLGLLGLEVVFLMLAVVVPLVLLAMLLILWLAPMKVQHQEMLLRICYILDTWSSLDVAVLVLVIANWEFSKFAEFLVYNGNLAAPCLMIKDLTRSECIHMDLTSRVTCAILVSAGFALLVLPKVTMRLCARALFAEVQSPAINKKVVDATESRAQDKDEAVEAQVEQAQVCSSEVEV